MMYIQAAIYPEGVAGDRHMFYTGGESVNKGE